jgi:hypothetical protein
MVAAGTVRKITPVLVVESIEPVVTFWTRLGVQPSTQVPGDHGLAFAIFSGEGVEVMYQTVASVKEDLVASASVREAFRPGPQQTTLYVQVQSLADVESRLQGERLILPRRTTFYGAIEVGYTDPAGNIIVFAERTEAGVGQ